MLGMSISKFNMISPKKIRRIALAVQNMPYSKALTYLSILPHKGARLIEATLKSAGNNLMYYSISNPKATSVVKPEEIIIRSIMITEGPTLKRIQPRARGRVDRVRKRTSHITIMVQERGGIEEEFALHIKPKGRRILKKKTDKFIKLRSLYSNTEDKKSSSNETKKDKK